MVNFPVTAVLGIALAVGMFLSYPAASELVVLGIPSIFILLYGGFFMPYSMAIWMYFDHLLHPLTNEDYEHFVSEHEGE